MKRIFIANQKADIFRALAAFKKKNGDSEAFFLSSKENLELATICQDSGLQKIELAPWSEKEREKFLREYIDVVGNISGDCTWSWWGTDIASRNRFASGIPDLLQEFFSLTRILEQNEHSLIVVLQPSWQIVSSLETFARKRGYGFFSPIGKWQYWQHHVYAWLHYTGSLITETINLIGRRWEARGIARKCINAASPRNQRWYTLKTFLYNVSAFGADGAYRDAFFGTLPDYLKGQGHNVLLYVRILGDYKSCIQKIRGFSAFPIIPFEALVRLSDIIKTICIVFFPNIHIRNTILFLDYVVTDIFINELHRTHNGLTLTTVLHYFATKRLLFIAPSDTFTLTYEGNPWEKMCIKGVRDASSKTSVIGYAHTVVPPAAAGMFPSTYERENMPRPDRVLTIGAVTKELLERYGAYQERVVQVACALRLEYLRGVHPFPREKAKRVLVALEGVTPVYQLAHYVLRELWNISSYELRFRSHPVLGLRDIAPLLSFDVTQLPPHIHESKGTSLTQDIKWAGVVMYWGSTVGLEALALGRPVIHYQNNSLLHYDPLFDCSALKWAVTNQTSLRPILDEIFTMPDGEYENKKIKAHEYLERYVYPINEESLKKFLW